MARLARVVVVGVGAFLFAACEVSNMIQLAPQQPADSLVFVIGGASDARAPTPVHGLSIVRCGDERPMWTIAADGSRRLPARVVYGAPIPGYSIRTGPDPLVAGCYKAFLSDASPLVFDVGPHGVVARRR